MELCLRFILVTVFLSGVSLGGLSSALEKPVSCDVGWIKYQKGNVCFKIFEGSGNMLEWTKARKSCQKLAPKTDLAIIPDGDTLMFLQGQINPWVSHWVGLNRRSDKRPFHWLDSDEDMQVDKFPENMIVPLKNAIPTKDCVFVTKVKWQKMAFRGFECDSSYAYICQTPVKVSCNFGWTKYQKGNVCFKIFEGPDNRFEWSEARERCQNLGPNTDLATIPDMDTFTFLQGRIKPLVNHWIGLNRQPDKGPFHWLDSNEDVNKLPESVTSPLKKAKSTNDCGLVKKPKGSMISFKDGLCDVPFSYICQTPVNGDLSQPLNKPVSCKADWVPFGKESCLKEVQDLRLTWYEARHHCQKLDSDLVVINNSEIEGFIVSKIWTKSRLYWTGLNRISNKGVYRWLDSKDKAGFLPTYTSLPSPTKGSGQYCAFGEIFKAGVAMKPISCVDRLNFLCQAKPSAAAETTPPPPKPTLDASSSLKRPTCRRGWTLYSTSQTCLKPINIIKKGWKDARNYCMRLDGDLAVLPDKDTSKFLKSLGNFQSGYYWIGMVRSDGKTYRWLHSKQEKQYTPRSTDVLNDGRYVEKNCVCAFKWKSSEELFLSRKKCREPLRFVCQMGAVEGPETTTTTTTTSTSTTTTSSSSTTTTTTTPGPGPTPSCPNGWKMDVKRKMCIKVFEDKKRTWKQSRDNCQKQGGDLVEVPDAESLEFVKGLMSRHRYWIGLLDKQHDGKFGWLSQTGTITFTAWNNKPRNIQGKEYCVENIGNHGARWNDKLCWKRRYSICQMKAETTTKT